MSETKVHVVTKDAEEGYDIDGAMHEVFDGDF